jgi:hypothetical protein
VRRCLLEDARCKQARNSRAAARASLSFVYIFNQRVAGASFFRSSRPASGARCIRPDLGRVNKSEHALQRFWRFSLKGLKIMTNLKTALRPDPNFPMVCIVAMQDSHAGASRRTSINASQEAACSFTAADPS